MNVPTSAMGQVGQMGQMGPPMGQMMGQMPSDMSQIAPIPQYSGYYEVSDSQAIAGLIPQQDPQNPFGGFAQPPAQSSMMSNTQTGVWICQNCKNDNWPQRKFCNRCKLPYPGIFFSSLLRLSLLLSQGFKDTHNSTKHSIFRHPSPLCLLCRKRSANFGGVDGPEFKRPRV